MLIFYFVLCQKSEELRRLAIGDIHGNLDALLAALENAHFDPAKDKLYFLGDYVDRHPKSRGVVDYILTVPDKICIRGNHDQYLLDHFDQTGPLRPISDQWQRNGGFDTLESYGVEIINPGTDIWFSDGDIPKAHLDFYKSALPYHITSDNQALVHGGFDLFLQDMTYDFVMWDRTMWKTALREEDSRDISFPCFREYPTIFIGHTNLLENPTQRHCLPKKCLNVWNLDTGAGYAGPLTVMDMETEEFWQSW